MSKQYGLADMREITVSGQRIEYVDKVHDVSPGGVPANAHAVPDCSSSDVASVLSGTTDLGTCDTPFDTPTGSQPSLLACVSVDKKRQISSLEEECVWCKEVVIVCLVVHFKNGNTNTNKLFTREASQPAGSQASRIPTPVFPRKPC
eukprot:5238190-Amphidinium_carterae.1